MFGTPGFTFFRALWIYIFGSVISPVLLLTPPCQQSLIDQCGRLITGFTPQKYLSGLVPDSAIRDDCEAFASVRLCNDKVLKPCLAAELVTLDPFIRQANEFIMLFCENDQFRRDYAHHGQCLAVVSLDINQCISNYGVTVSDIAAISDNLAPQEVLHRSCCDGLHRLTQCSFEAAVRKCHPSSADFVKKFLYKMMKSTLQDWIARQCFEYQTQCSRDFSSVDESTGRQPTSSGIITLLPSSVTPPEEPTVTVTPETTTSTITTTTTTTTPLRVAEPEPLPVFTSNIAATGTRSSVTKNTGFGDFVAVGTDNILSHSMPDPNVHTARGMTNLHNVVNSSTTEGGVVVVAAGFPSVLPLIPVATPVPTIMAADEVPGPQVPQKTASIKTFPEKTKARIRNLGADTHPLARKFLLIISTIAFLAGWY